MSVYQQDNFYGRVGYAAGFIASGRPTNRTFDTCFEMNDGDAVCLALLRRIEKRPETKLAKNIWRYLDRDCVSRIAVTYAGRSPKRLSQELIAGSAVAVE